MNEPEQSLSGRAGSSPENAGPQQIRENLTVLAIGAFLRGAHNSAYSVIWQPFVLSLGASMPTVGMLNSLGGINGIVTTLVQPLGGWFADRLGRRPFLIASSLALMLGYALFTLAGLTGWWGLLAFGVAGLGVSALANPSRSSMTAESVTADRHGMAFSLIMLATIVPGIVAPALGGIIVGRWGYVSFFPLAIALEAAALVLVWRYLHETIPPIARRIRGRDALQVLARAALPPPGLRGFFIAVAGDSFSWGLGWGLLYGMLTQTLHMTAEQLGIMSSVMSVTWAIAQMPIGRYVDRHGTKGAMLLSEAIGIPLLFIWITQTRFEFFVLGQMLFAVTAATWSPVVNTYLTRHVGSAERAEAFGRLNMFRGLVAFPAPAIGGFLYAWGGMSLPMMANLAGVLIVLAILTFFVHDSPRERASSIS